MVAHDVGTAAMPVGELFVAALTKVEHDDGEQQLPSLTALHECGSQQDRTMTSVANLLGVSRSMLYGAPSALLPAVPLDSRPGPTIEQYAVLLARTVR